MADRTCWKPYISLDVRTETYNMNSLGELPHDAVRPSHATWHVVAAVQQDMTPDVFMDWLPERDYQSVLRCVSQVRRS